MGLQLSLKVYFIGLRWDWGGGVGWGGAYNRSVLILGREGGGIFRGKLFWSFASPSQNHNFHCNCLQKNSELTTNLFFVLEQKDQPQS